MAHDDPIKNTAHSPNPYEEPPDKETIDQDGVSRPPADYHIDTARPVFVIEDSFYRSRTPRAAHWSIAWSDLMMTMFILFLTLFIYQLAHREFLAPNEVEVVSGSVISVPPETDPFAVPFHPISPQISEHKADRLKKLESTDEIIQGDMEITAQPPPIGPPIETALDRPVPTPPEPEPAPSSLEVGELTIAEPKQSVDKTDQPSDHVITGESGQTTVTQTSEPKSEQEEIISEIYDLSQLTVTEEKLERFASVELIPDKAMRIILTGDLLFATGEAELTVPARTSLGKLFPIIAQSPYMINVVGHTDSVPMHSVRYPTNWELSTARASRVARFLIEEMGLPGSQIVVSGFSYFRPVKPNTTEDNKRANRRVEIILSKELPPVVQADANNLSNTVIQR